MLSNISWSNYFMVVVAASLFYYLVVVVVYYRGDLLQAFKKRALVSTSEDEQSPPWEAYPQKVNEAKMSVQMGKTKNQEGDESHQISSFTDEVRAYFEQIKEKGVEKEKLMQSLRVIAGKYSSLGNSGSKYMLEQFVTAEAELHCAVALGENEVSNMWNRG